MKRDETKNQARRGDQNFLPLTPDCLAYMNPVSAGALAPALEVVGWRSNTSITRPLHHDDCWLPLRVFTVDGAEESVPLVSDPRGEEELVSFSRKVTITEG